MRIHYKRTHTQNTYPPAIAAQPEAPPRRRTAALTAHQSTNAPIHQFTHTLHSPPPTPPHRDRFPARSYHRAAHTSDRRDYAGGRIARRARGAWPTHGFIRAPLWVRSTVYQGGTGDRHRGSNTPPPAAPSTGAAAARYAGRCGMVQCWGGAGRGRAGRRVARGGCPCRAARVKTSSWAKS